MNFDLTEDQRLLRDAVGRLMAGTYGFEARRAHAREPAGWSAAMWRRYAEMGLHGLLVPEAHGGSGGGGVELMLVMQALGRALALEPFLAGAVLPAAAIEQGGTPAQRAALLPKLADGSLRAAIAHAEPGSRGHPTDVRCTAYFNGNGWLLKGAKQPVLQAEGADLLIVSARVAGTRFDPDGIRLFVLDARAPGIEIESRPMQDGRRSAGIRLDGVAAGSADAMSPDMPAASVIERVAGIGIAATVADMLGAMEALHEMTVDYLKTRVQFGRPIGANQALQHRAVDMYVALEQARSMAILAAVALAEGDGAARARHLSMAKAHVGQLARALGQAAIQLHGGIGMTEEYAAGHYFRRLLVDDQLFGDSHHHLRLLGDSLS